MDELYAVMGTNVTVPVGNVQAESEKKVFFNILQSAREIRIIIIVIIN